VSETSDAWRVRLGATQGRRSFCDCPFVVLSDMVPLDRKSGALALPHAEPELAFGPAGSPEGRPTGATTTGFEDILGPAAHRTL
jgi:hypothetical protein